MEEFHTTCFLLLVGLWPTFSRCYLQKFPESDNSGYSFNQDNDWPSGEVKTKLVYGSGVAIDISGNVAILHRGSPLNDEKSNHTIKFIKEDVLLVISSRTGKVLKTWGINKFVKPHGIAIDSENNLFITDIGLHQVFKFRFDRENGVWENQALLVLGEEFVPGEDPYHFCRPTDVAILSDGTFYVADGYCNSRIVYFNKLGHYRGEFYAGSPSSGDVTSFNVTHSVAVAEVENEISGQSSPSSISIVFVADRNNLRVQAFSPSGTFLYQIPFSNTPYIYDDAGAMLLSIAFKAFDKSAISEDRPIGELYAIVGHLPFGESKIFEIIVGKNGYHFRRSFFYSTLAKRRYAFVTNDKLYRNILRLETPHDIAVSNGGNTIFVIEAFQSLIVKKFDRIRPSDVKSGSSEIATGTIALLILLLLLETM